MEPEGWRVDTPLLDPSVVTVLWPPSQNLPFGFSSLSTLVF